MTSRIQASQFTGLRRLLPALVNVLFLLSLPGCQSAPTEPATNKSLPLEVNAAVPESWRAAASAAPGINTLAVSQDMRDFIATRLQGKSSQRARMLALSNAIFDPDGIGLVYADAATHTAQQAFTTGLGNCMGFSNLMVAAAREAGFNASFELVSNFQNWQQHGDLLVRTLHVRVVSRVRDKKLVFDFYPQPVEPGSWSQALSDQQALAHHLNNLAAAAMQEGDYAQSYAQLWKALHTSPEISFLWSNLGALLSRQGLSDLAENAYHEAIRLDPDQLTAVSNLQRMYLRLGRQQEADKLAGQVQRYRERNPYYHFWVAEQAYAEERFKNAVDSYSAAIRLKKNERSFYKGLAKSYYKLGKTIQARKAISKSHEIFSPEADTVVVRPSR